MNEKKSQTDSGYKRTLSNAHIQLIALGGTIGTGLFLGVGDSIHRAGPSVILIYIIVGIFLFLLMRALGEMIMSDLINTLTLILLNNISVKISDLLPDIFIGLVGSL